MNRFDGIMQAIRDKDTRWLLIKCYRLGQCVEYPEDPTVVHQPATWNKLSKVISAHIQQLSLEPIDEMSICVARGTAAWEYADFNEFIKAVNAGDIMAACKEAFKLGYQYQRAYDECYDEEEFSGYHEYRDEGVDYEETLRVLLGFYKDNPTDCYLAQLAYDWHKVKKRVNRKRFVIKHDNLSATVEILDGSLDVDVYRNGKIIGGIIAHTDGTIYLTKSDAWTSLDNSFRVP